MHIIWNLHLHMLKGTCCPGWNGYTILFSITSKNWLLDCCVVEFSAPLLPLQLKSLLQLGSSVLENCLIFFWIEKNVD